MGKSWCRLYSDVIRNRKIEYACRLTQEPKVIILGAWVALLALASESPRRGQLWLTEDVKYTATDINDVWGFDATTGQRVLTAFINTGLVHWDGLVLHVTNFHKRNPFSDTAQMSPDWAIKRADILCRDDGVCQYCREPATHVDHIIPRSQGGTDDYTNLVAACADCNIRKGGRTPKQAGMELATDATMEKATH